MHVLSYPFDHRGKYWSLAETIRADPRSWDSRANGWSGQAAEHDADHGETDEGDDGCCVTLEISRQAPVAADPRQCAFDDPTLRYDHEFVQLISLDDLYDPTACVGRGQCNARPLITGVGEDAQDERKQRPCPLVQNQRGTVAILDIGRVNGNAQQEAERIDKDVALAPRDLLGRVKPLRIEQSPPFGAVLALWLSMIAAVGLASRPACSRVAT